jgi:hypothetical protein
MLLDLLNQTQLAKDLEPSKKMHQFYHLSSLGYLNLLETHKNMPKEKEPLITLQIFFNL